MDLLKLHIGSRTRATDWKTFDIEPGPEVDHVGNCKDLSQFSNRIQLTSDGHGAYKDAVHDVFLDQVDFAQLVKVYGEPVENYKRYSPAPCIGCKRQRVIGKPDKKHISTSFVERQNLTMRMHMRRFTRLTNAFSKKADNHIHAVALHFMFYNFCRIHKTLRIKCDDYNKHCDLGFWR